MFEFDHFFTFVDPSFKESIGDKKDFKIGYEREHKGQGTSSIFSFFNSFYREWIWLSNLEDAKNSKPRADLRSNWKNSGWSPFGIGLRGKLSQLEKKDFYCYKPPYAPSQSLWIHNESLEVPYMPMIFVQEMAEDSKFEDWWPKKRLGKNSDFEKWFYKDAESIEISLVAPKLTTLPLDITGVNVVDGANFKAKLSIKGFDSIDLGLNHMVFV